jgi:hypothetical protein
MHVELRILYRMYILRKKRFPASRQNQKAIRKRNPTSHPCRFSKPDAAAKF